ncbi:MAG: bifunctional hydroxymethylpyrimidine kinase/phosphomethylpyrimidine kinase [Campylobacterota bacterium]|nr:bifunctional hydroxymethylpyrimidine kinase/phosphomethylpyrimidine kinase [Campylobacterota bacterium]
MKVVLSIAGSDCSGGAGIQADIKTFEAFGVFGSSVVTVLTAQNTKGVTAISEVEPSFIKEQLEAVKDDFDIAAIKIGMLYSNEIIDVVREFIKDLNIPIVFDPVFISKAGSKLLNKNAIENLKTIIPYATVVTPNLFEAKEIFGYEFANSDSLEEITNSNTPILIKNHIQEINLHNRSVDTLYNKREKLIFDTPYRETNNTHGTGCSYSSAIAANLALGKTLEESIQISKKFIYLAIKNAPTIGHGKGPIAHKIGGEICHVKED